MPENLIKFIIQGGEKEELTSSSLDLILHLQTNPPKFQRYQRARQILKIYQPLDKLHLSLLGIGSRPQLFTIGKAYGSEDTISGFRFEQYNLTKPKYQYFLMMSEIWVDEEELEDCENP